MEVKPLDN